MKKILSIIPILLLSLLVQSPAKANKNADACLNQVIKSELSRSSFKKVDLISSIIHQGSEYYSVFLTPHVADLPRTEVILKITGQSGCEVALKVLEGDLATKEDYYQLVDREVIDKFIQASQQR